jgi:hypothetical protein
MQSLENTDLPAATNTDSSAANSAANGSALPADYQTWRAQAKLDFLWEQRILPSQYTALPRLKKIDILGLFLTPLKTKMDRSSDEAPESWQKALHAHGTVAKVRFRPDPETPFTGLFKGADYGLLRLSVTGDPAARGFAPGLALKLLVDGKPAANLSALVSLEGQGKNYNLLANEFSNIVPEATRLGPKLINLLFRRVSRFPTQLYLQDFAAVTQTGQTEPQPHHPDQIFLVPNPALQFPTTPHDFRQDFATVSAGTLLFDVYGVDPKRGSDQLIGKPEYRQQAELIGQIETTSEFVASDYGDRRLFFRHQRFRNR